MHLALGNGEFTRSKVSDYAAYERQTRRRGSYLPMQGPPGTGKTYTAAEQIVELIAQGRTVGITGPSHAVICRLIDSVYEHASWCDGTPRIGQRADHDNPHLHPRASMMDPDVLVRALRLWPAHRRGAA